MPRLNWSTRMYVLLDLLKLSDQREYPQNERIQSKRRCKNRPSILASVFVLKRLDRYKLNLLLEKFYL